MAVTSVTRQSDFQSIRYTGDACTITRSPTITGQILMRACTDDISETSPSISSISSQSRENIYEL
eukprot:1366787-Amorphochlora_amoeboformis.AAC.1